MKRAQSVQGALNFKTKKKKSSNSSKSAQEPPIFKNQNVYILQSGLITKLRHKIFTENIEKFGGEISKSVIKDTTHVIIDDTINWGMFCKISKWDHIQFSHISIVKSEWLSKCLKEKTLLSTTGYELKPLPRVEKSTTDQIPGVSTAIPQSLSQIKVSGFVCSKPSTEKQNFNKHITDKLEMLAETYKNTKDHWREYGYTKAISALKKYPREITTYEEAKALPGVGERLALKISEIIESGQLRKLDEVNEDEKIKATNLFAQVWGAGPSTAETWVQQGYRTLDNLREKATLNKQQEIGLKHYHDFLERMPREEAAQIIDIVKEAALSLHSGLEIIGCGSFRRGRLFCGDIDILISHLKEELEPNFLMKLVTQLHENGLLTDDLTTPDSKGDSQRSKYMGVCKLKGDNKKYRRIDLFTSPAEEFATALLAYTGSGHFNRSMRLLARKKGMALSDQSLMTGVIRKGAEKVHNGRRLDTPTEESVFCHLGLEYRTPEERDV